MAAGPTGGARWAYRIARCAVAAVWAWHGLVPKLLVEHPDEAAPLLVAGFDQELAWMLVHVAGWCELLLAALVLVFWRQRWPLALTAGLMLAAVAGIAATDPTMFLAAFNPLTLSLAVAALATVAWLLHPPAPSTS